MRVSGFLLVVLALSTVPLGAMPARAQGPDAPQGAPHVIQGNSPAATESHAAPAPGSGATTTLPATAANIPALRTQAQAGDQKAQVNLGAALLLNKPSNPQEALEWFRKASDQGNAIAATNIGEMYYNGLGVAKNPVEAAKWYRLGADRGSASAQNQLGRLYENGQGVPQDFAEALKYYRLGADQRNAAAQSNLGAMYANGRGVPQNQTEAVRLFRLGADQGNPFAQANLGMQYLAGKGVGQNDAAAYFWLNLAAARLPASVQQVRDQTARGRDVVAARLAPAELERMQKLAAAWRPGTPNVPADGPGGPQTAGAPAAARPPGAASGGAASSGARMAGTGFVVSQSGAVLTNNHVVTQCREIRARHGTTALGVLSLVAADTQNDLALLKLPSHFTDAAVFRDERGVRQGDTAIAYGFPLAGGLSSGGALTTGTISALAGLANDSRILQISTPVQPGNSGGPLLDAGGNVLGVVTAQLNALKVAAATGTLPQNVNFAIKASVARNFLDANAIDYRTSPATKELSVADVGDRAKKFTLFIECMK
jgi:TPR repeat protein